MIKNPRVGQIAWFEEHWSGTPTKCKIETVSERTANIKALDGARGNYTNMPLDRLFTTKQELLDAMHDKSNKHVASIKASIQTVEDLVRYMYDHVVANAEEYTDYDARRAVRERARELLNIDLSM